MVPKNFLSLVTTADRFHAKVDKSAECWQWTGFVNPDSGYGQFWDSERLVRAHRYSYELEVGPIPHGMVLDHTCHNDTDCTDVPCVHRSCVNPAHLEPVTQSINSIRGRSGDHQSAKTECSKGHYFSIENTILGTSQNGRPRRSCRTCVRASQAKYIAKRKAA